MYVFFTTYAIGLYVDPKDLRAALSSFKGTGPVEGQAVFNALQEAALTKRIRLIPTNDTSGSHLRNGLVTAIASRMSDYKAEALQAFADFFPTQLMKGTPIDFTSDKEGKLIVCVDGTEVGRVHSAELSRAFFDIYFGENTKTPEAKKHWANSIAECLR